MQMRSFATAALGALLAIGCSAGHTPGDGGTDAAVFVPVAVDTVASTRVNAGQPLVATCVLIDEEGEEHALPPELEASYRVAPEGSFDVTDGTIIPIRTGLLEVSCRINELGLVDESPALVAVVPAQPFEVITHLEPDSIVAGDTFTASCEVFDPYGNEITDALPAMRAEPSDHGNTFTELVGTFQRAGRFEVFCDVDGAETRGAMLEVRPGLPASIVISRVPEQSVYAIGQTVDIARVVADEYGNVIPDAVAPVTSSPFRGLGEQLGDGRFRFFYDGVYTLTARVQQPTHNGEDLSATTTVVVDQNGPAIGCDDPYDGAILNIPPGTLVNFRGTVNDLSGVNRLTVNGINAQLDGDGSFHAAINTRYGINFIDIAAVDGTGREASRTCAFLVANRWAPDDRTLSDTVSLRLRQPAVDDSNRADGLDSFADILSTVLNSRGLVETLHSQLLAANPLKPSACDEDVWGVCVLRSAVVYLDSQVGGPNSVTLTLVNGGIQASVRIENLRVRIRVYGHVAGIPYDTTGWVTFRSIDVSAIFDTRLSGGRPQMNVRSGSVSASVGTISTNFSGIDGAIIDIVVSLFQGTVRNLVRDLVRDWITNNFDRVLDGVLGGLDIDSLGTTFDVPRLDGGNLRVTFGIGFSTLDTTPSRMLFGIGTRLYAPATQARPTFGAPVQVNTRLLDASGTQTTAVAMHEAVLSQALHALWRGGFFDATLSSATVNGLPQGMSATISTGLPPVPILRSDGRVELQLGAVYMRLVYPAIFPQPVDVMLGARASMTVSLAGEDLTFGDFRIEELFFSTNLASLDMATRDTIEGFLRRLLERVMWSALEGALPAIPIPSFPIPASLGGFGLPVGAELGITTPTLGREAPHFVLRGGFAVR
jgi:hypothetical protein